MQYCNNNLLIYSQKNKITPYLDFLGMTWGRELCKNEYSVILTKFPQLNPPNKRILNNFYLSS